MLRKKTTCFRHLRNNLYPLKEGQVLALFMKKTLVVLVILVIILSTTTAVFFYLYEQQKSANTQLRKLENSILITDVNDCVASNFQNSQPSVSYLYRMLPEYLKNSTIDGWGLEDYWPSPVNSTNYILYEVWNVTYFFPPESSYGTHNLPFLFMLYTVNCTIPIPIHN